ncbi:hypothetical protein SDC9_167304 [bioreactor metagenome]|uniref:Uncharacterized protein n=1 Tax=bioreactor metagenome TaxID=1076179 RepID=A0A645G287_9ZZZZ
MRQVAVERVQEVKPLVGTGATDVHMLAEDRELLGQVAVQHGQFLEARLVEDALLRPALEGMRAAAADADVEAVAGLDQGIPHLAELTEQGAVIGVHVGRNFDHALGDFRLHIARERLLAEQEEHVGRCRSQVEIGEIDELQFQLDAHGQCVASLECFKRHFCPPRVRLHRPGSAPVASPPGRAVRAPAPAGPDRRPG